MTISREEKEISSEQKAISPEEKEISSEQKVISPEEGLVNFDLKEKPTTMRRFFGSLTCLQRMVRQFRPLNIDQHGMLLHVLH